MKQPMHNEHKEYVVTYTYTEAPGVTTIALTMKDGVLPSFISGQYINVYFPELNTPEGKAYSISSAPHEDILTLTVRDIGEFSHRLATLKEGDVLLGSLPYGYFYSESEETDLVFLAGGIGITPFRSMLRHMKESGRERRVHLFHSIRSESDAVFREEFARLEEELRAFRHMHFITREHVPETDKKRKGRMSVADILAQVTPNEHTEFLICGSISFTRDMWRALREAGIDEDHLYTEAFFTHS